MRKMSGRWMSVLSLTVLLLTAGVARAEGSLHLYNWNNYLAPETAKAFEERCQCRLVQSYYGDNEEMLAKLVAGAKGYDIVVPTGYALQALIRQKALQPLDLAKLPNLKNMDPAYIKTKFDPEGTYSVPYAYTTTVIGYNRQAMEKAGIQVDGWDAIFDPRILEKIKGKITVLDSSVELMAAALKYLGYPASDLDEAHLKQAADVIGKAKPYWAAFNASSYIKELTVGNIWIAHGYSNDFYQAGQDARAAARPFEIVSIVPKQGATLSLDSLVLLKDAPRPDLALQFMNFMMEGKNAAQLVNMTGSGSPNLAARAFVKPAVLSMPSIFPDASTRRRLDMLSDLNGKQRRTLTRLWTQVRAQ